MKYFARNVARLGTGRDIGKNLSVWAGVAPASFSAGPLFTAPALRALPQQPGGHPTQRAPDFIACRIHFTGRAIAGAFPVALRAPYNAPAIASNQIMLRPSAQSVMRLQPEENERKADAEPKRARRVRKTLG